MILKLFFDNSSINSKVVFADEEWLDWLKALIDDAALRQRLGAAGRQTIEERYSMRQCASLFANVIRETVAKQNAQSEVKRWFLLKSKNNVP